MIDKICKYTSPAFYFIEIPASILAFIITSFIVYGVQKK